MMIKLAGLTRRKKKGGIERKSRRTGKKRKDGVCCKLTELHGCGGERERGRLKIRAGFCTSLLLSHLLTILTKPPYNPYVQSINKMKEERREENTEKRNWSLTPHLRFSSRHLSLLFCVAYAASVVPTIATVDAITSFQVCLIHF